MADLASGTARPRSLRDRIEAALDRDVRPEFEGGGGGIEVVGVDIDGIVQVRLSGACQGCSHAAIAMSMQIEAVVKASVPEVRFFEPVP